MLALRYYPKHKESRADYTLFSEICEAYEVLNDPTLKACYDRYGMHYLKNNLFKDIPGGYAFNNNPEKIYHDFFNSKDRVSALTSKYSMINQLKSSFIILIVRFEIRQFFV